MIPLVATKTLNLLLFKTFRGLAYSLNCPLQQEAHLLHYSG